MVALAATGLWRSKKYKLDNRLIVVESLIHYDRQSFNLVYCVNSPPRRVLARRRYNSCFNSARIIRS